MIQFDSKAAYKDLSDAFAEAMGQLVGLVHAQAQANVPDAEVRASLQAFLDMTLPGYFEGIVFSDSWKAWIEHWGRGSLAANATMNPDLPEYMANRKLFNQLRDASMTILGRPAGTWDSITGETFTTKGRAAGRDIERLVASGALDKWLASKNMSRNDLLPKPPNFFLRDALLSNEKKILDVMQGVLDRWTSERFGLFIVTEEG